MADILTLEEYKDLAGITRDTNDGKYAAALPGVTAAILGYTGRDFTTAPVTESRQFQFDDSGFLDIDDAVSITTVKAIIPWGTDYTFTEDEWYAQPPRRDDSSVYWYLAIPGWVGGSSPEMGFTYNADVMYREGRWRSKPIMLEVTATWGWARIPDDVKMAAKWTLDDWIARRPETAAPAESIESYSRGALGAANLSEAVAWGVPMRARDLLSPYTKVNV